MDQIKIGKFISEMRKEQSLTQSELAEMLFQKKLHCQNGVAIYPLKMNCIYWEAYYTNMYQKSVVEKENH